MKTFFLTLLLSIIVINPAFSQGTAINATGAPADNSALLDLSSTSQGILIPRMSKTEKLAITSPATGLMIYQNDDTTGFWFYNGAKWISILSQTSSSSGNTHYIGEQFGGGIIFYLSNGGQNGLIAAASDQSSAAPWSNIDNVLIGAAAQSRTDGLSNTNAIIAQGASAGAAYICYNLTLNGFSDWYLPSIEEIHLLYDEQFSVGGFTRSYPGYFFWSSTEKDATKAWCESFGSAVYYGGGSQYDTYTKNTATYKVRCIRSF